jgi:alpha-mannosidase
MSYIFDVGSLLEKLQAKSQKIKKYRGKLKWKFFQGIAADAYKTAFDDSSWKEVGLPLLVDARKGESWLRCEVIVPSHIAGIEVSISVAKLSSSIILAGSEIFVNSRKVLRADYWTELRGPKIVLKEGVKPQERYLIAIHILPYYEPVHVPAFTITYSQVEKVAFEIDSFIQELKFVKNLREDVVRQVVVEFNLEVFKKPADLVMEIEKARITLLKVSEAVKEFKVHLIGHAHIDMNWLWPWKDTVDTIKGTFTTMVDLMTRSPDLHFSQSQAVTYRVAEEESPEFFEMIKRNVKDGRWEVTAATWVEGDLNMGGTEALIRQILYANRYIKKKLGVEPEICWEPDTFGHIWTYPQILRKSGLKYYYFMRCGKEAPLFWWEGPDGSRVLAFTSVYNNFVSPENVVEISQKIFDKYGLKTSMFIYGVGDHGGGPTIEDVEAVHRLQKKPALPKIIFSSAQSFFKEVEPQLNSFSIPVVKDELNTTFDGCYTTHSDIKRYNRLCERLLVDAEKFCVLSEAYPKEELHKAWLNALFNQFHDILCGSGACEAYTYSSELAQETIETAQNALRNSVKKIAEKINFSKNGISVVVFNSLSWDRVDVAKVKVPKDRIPKNPIAVSAEGERVPVQIEGDEALFVATVPSMGYKTYYLTEGEAQTGNLAEESNIENEYLRVELDPVSGTIKSMYDKLNDRFVFKKQLYEATMPEASNLLQVLYEMPHSMSAWIIGEISRVENLVKGAEVKLLENGPVKATVKAVHKHHNSEISQYISIYRNIPRLDIFTTIDWREISDEKTDAPMLKVAFTPILGKTKAVFEIPFGYIERASDGREVPALRWMDISDNEYGVSLLNDSKYGFDVKGNTMRMTLVRTSYSPEPRPDYGKHELLYSIYPHKGDWKKAQTFKRGYEVNHPLESLIMTGSSSRGSMPETKSFIQIKPENIVISCVKKTEDSNDIVIRMYDATGKGAEAEVLFDFKIEEASEVDLLEREIDKIKLEGERVIVDLKPFEIKTLRIRTSQVQGAT